MQAQQSWLTDPTVFAVNRLDAHSDHVCYATQAEADAGVTSLRQPLDGVWHFAYSPCPAQRPADFWQEGYDLARFGTIRVPGHIELQGYGQIQYINTLYPWDGHAELCPPQIDWENTPVGSYVREFTLAPGLRGKPVCVSFQGVEQAFYLWCNGQFVGYAEDSFTPSEFELTPYLREGVNRLCVEVYKFSSAAWLEDQDMFRFSGIFRSVYLYARPALHVEDVWFMAGLARDNATGILQVRLRLAGPARAARVQLRLGTLYDGALPLTERDGFWYSPELHFAGVTPWCHETPALYPAALTLADTEGQVCEVVPYAVGFRRFELENGVMKLNGRRVVFNGVNRHEWNPQQGRAITAADMKAAMQTFQRNHINAVRTSHYPNQTLWYHLCDQNGIYMIDEANLESHGTWQIRGAVDPSRNVPGDRPEWKACVVDRARSMLERDKNHPAVLLWSCGNESYAGADIQAMSDFFHQADPSRLVHYEGVFHNRQWDAISDVESRMYATPQQVRAYLESRPAKPFILCEYMHDMGNSLGGMESYIRLGEEFEQYQGGFIWDYMDQALWHTDAAGRRVLGYGGDFGDRQSDYNFSANGIVFADGREKPAMQEVRYWYDTPARRAAQDAANAAARAEAQAQLAAAQQRPAAGVLRTARGDGALGVRGSGFEVLFSRLEGGPVSLRCGGAEWLWRAPRLAFWRAATENDLGNGFAWRSALWQAADAWQEWSGPELLERTEQTVRVRYTCTVPAVPGVTGSITYTVDPLGRLRVEAVCQTDAALPELPAFGVRFATPAPLEQTEWQGLSGETYPDRQRGGVFGVHTETPPRPEYLVPQEYGCHTGTVRAWLHGKGGTLEVQQLDAPFAFSALPYTPQQLDAAAHGGELPAPARTVVTVYGAMRGVGGINSWGADVEPPYRLPAGREYSVRFLLAPGALG